MTLLKKIITATSAIAMIVLTTPAIASESVIQSDQKSNSAYMKVYNETLPPIGFVQFCKTAPQDCGGTLGEAVRVVMNNERWNDLNSVNLKANETVEAIMDIDLYNVEEYWTYPGTQGDCEDFVLLKRKKLMMMGWPTETLLITVLRDENNEGHAVLTVATDKADYILDNRFAEIRSFQETGYTYYKRQSQTDPRRWVSLKPGKTTVRVGDVAGLGSN